jgi:hypothetical protein
LKIPPKWPNKNVPEAHDHDHEEEHKEEEHECDGKQKISYNALMVFLNE